MKFFSLSSTGRDIFFILLIFLIIPNLLGYCIAYYGGVERPYVYVDYFLISLPLFFKQNKITYGITSCLFIAILIIDILFIALLCFNFGADMVFNFLQDSSVNYDFAKNIIFEYNRNDLRPFSLSYLGLLVILFSSTIFAISLHWLKEKKPFSKKFIPLFLFTFFISSATYYIISIRGIMNLVFIIVTLIIFLILIYSSKIKLLKINFKLRYWLSILVMLVFLITATSKADKDAKIISSLFNLEDLSFSNINSFSDFNLPIKMDGLTGKNFEVTNDNIDSNSSYLFKKIASDKSKDLKYDKIFLLVVESFGVAENKDFQNEILSALNDKEFKENYNVTSSEIPFNGFTVSGEFRELCHLRFNDSFPEPTTSKKEDFANCLPQLLSKKGYETIGLHNAYGNFFSRSTWYPLINFNKIYFRDGLEKDFGKGKICGTAFKAICEDRLVEDIMFNMADNDKKQFIYFLTVEGHLPVDMEDSVSDDFMNICKKYNLTENNEVICKLSYKHYSLLKYIKSLALELKNKKVLIMIAGDHKPPFYYKGYSDQFKSGVVPGIIIESR